MAGTRQVKVVISGDASGVQAAAGKTSTALGGTATQAESVAKRIGGAFGRAGSAVGGEFGMIINQVGGTLDSLGEKGSKVGAKMTAGGAGVAVLGSALTMMGSGEKDAQNQLQAAIDDTGGSLSDYSKKIEDTVKHEENFAHSSKDTDAALTVLTEATNDPNKALSEMGVVTDLAAAKHESLAEAAGAVAKILGGAGAKTLKGYGITMVSSTKATAALTTAQKANQTAIGDLSKAKQKLSDLEAVDAGKTKLSVAQQIALRNAHDAVATAEVKVKTTSENLTTAQANVKNSSHGADDALTQLGKKLAGQPAASVDSFGGKVRVLRTKLDDWAAQFGQKYGPAITAAGVIMTAAGSVIQIAQSRAAAAATKETAAVIKANAEQAASYRSVGTAAQGAATEVGAAETEIAAETKAGSGGIAGIGKGAVGKGAGAAEADAAGAAEGEAGAAAGAGGLAAVATVAAPIAAAAASVVLLGAAVNKLDGDMGRFKSTNAMFDAFKDGTKNVNSFTDALGQDNDTVGTATATYAAAQIQAYGLDKQFASSGATLGDLTAAVTGTDTEFGNLVSGWEASGHVNASMVAQLAKMHQEFEVSKGKADALKTSQTELNNAVDQFKSPPAVGLFVNDHATKVISQAKTELADLNGREADIYIGAITENQGTFTSHGKTGSVKFFAGGGKVDDGLFVAGEGGVPELFSKHGSDVEILSGSAMRKLVTAGGGSSTRASSSGGGGSDTIAVHLYLDGTQVHQSLLKVRRRRGQGLGLE